MRWLGPDGQPLDTCSSLTTGANRLIATLHDRMPVIVAPEDYARWLDPDDPDPQQLVKPFDGQRMKLYPVSTKVNSVRHDDASCIDRMPGGETLQAQDVPQGPETTSQKAGTAASEADQDVPEQSNLF